MSFVLFGAANAGQGRRHGKAHRTHGPNASKTDKIKKAAELYVYFDTGWLQ